MSNLQNNIIQEYIMENLESLFDEDKEFYYNVCSYSDENSDGYMHDDNASEVAFEFLEHIANDIFESLDGTGVNSRATVKELAYNVIGGE